MVGPIASARRYRLVASLLVAPLLAATLALAVTRATMAQSDKPAAPPQQQQPQLPVSAEQALYLIRSTLLTLNDANRSGNYSVLRDLAAPEFQAKNTAADLALGFTDLRRRNFDLFSVALAAPQLSTPPYLDPNKMLRLTGFFPTRPLQINFDLATSGGRSAFRSRRRRCRRRPPRHPPLHRRKRAPPRRIERIRAARDRPCLSLPPGGFAPHAVPLVWFVHAAEPTTPLP
jgi:hypothetical protein